MSNLTGEEGSFSSGNGADEVHQHHDRQHNQQPNGSGAVAANISQPAKKKRNLPGTPDPTAEVVALSPTTLMATNRFVCEICNKGFQRDQNLQLHRRGHNLPWKLRQRTSTEVRKRVYICPEPSCVHHNPSRALGDLTGIKKHFSRKHGEKKWKCDKCSKKYAVQSDWKAHQKTCGTREYKCDCGTIFSRRDSFITHRAFCDALAEENNKVNQVMNTMPQSMQGQMPEFMSTMGLNPNANPSMGLSEFNNFDPKNPLKSLPQDLASMPFKPMNMVGGMFSTASGTLFGSPKGISSSSSGLQLSSNSPPSFNYLQENNKNGGNPLSGTAHMSATALLQKAAQMGATSSSNVSSPMMQKSYMNNMAGHDQLSGGPKSSSYGQQHNTPFDTYPTQTDHQSTLMGMSGGFNQLFNKNPQEVSRMFDSGNGPSALSDMGLFGGMLVGTDQNPSFMKNMEQEDHGDNQSIMRNSMRRSPAGASRMLPVTGSDVTTVDFLGIGGSRAPPSLHEHQRQQQQRLEMEAMSQHRMHLMHPSFHQQLSHDDTAGDKPLWDI